MCAGPSALFPRTECGKVTTEKKWQLCDVVQVLAKATVVIDLQSASQIDVLYTLNLLKAVYPLKLSKAGKSFFKKQKVAK